MKRLRDIFKKSKAFFFTIGIIGLFLNIILFQSINSIMLLPVILYWIFLGIRYKLDERYFFGIALLFLVLSVPPFLTGHMVIAERLSVWEYLFLILGLWQWFIFDIIVPKIKR